MSYSPPPLIPRWAQYKYGFHLKKRTPDCSICKTYLRYIAHYRNRRDHYDVLNYLGGAGTGEGIVANGHFPIAHKIHSQTPDRLAFNTCHLTDDEWLARQPDPQDVVYRATWLSQATITRFYSGKLDVEIQPDELLTAPEKSVNLVDTPPEATPQRARREDRADAIRRLNQKLLRKESKQRDPILREIVRRAVGTSDC